MITTCVSQIWTNTMQKQFGVSSTQLLFASSPFMAATLGLIAVPLDSALVGGTPFEFDYTTAVTCVAILSCLIAVAVNFSTFLVIGKCDAVTYQVLGHLKTMLVLAFGFFMLNNPANWRNICGILTALGGMVAYGYCENLDKQAEAQKSVLPSSSGKSQQ